MFPSQPINDVYRIPGVSDFINERSGNDLFTGLETKYSNCRRRKDLEKEVGHLYQLIQDQIFTIKSTKPKNKTKRV